MSRSSRRAFPTQHPEDVARVAGEELNNLLTEIDLIRTRLSGTGLINAPVLSRGSTDTHVASTAFQFHILGVSEAKAAVAAGTAIGAQTIPANKWASYRMSIAAGGTITITPAAANATGYATEALAIAAVPACPAGQTDMGYFTNLGATDTAWIAATDALQGGSSGTPASDTNFYPATATIGSQVAKTLDIAR